MNRSVIVGRLTKDVDLRYTQTGKAVANFTVAVNRPFKNQQGEQEADFILCNCWGKQAENLANYMKKGSQIGVDGRIQTRSFDGQDGKKVFVTKVVADNIQFLESKSNSNSESTQQQRVNTYNNEVKQAQTYEQAGEEIDVGGDDLPF